MNIWYIHHYASPPDAGLAGRPFNLARSLNRLGHRVINVCASNHHFRSRPATHNEVDRIVRSADVEYLQLSVRPYSGNSLGRLANMLEFARRLRKLRTLCGQGVIPKPDVLIPSCVHPFVFAPARKLAKAFCAGLIYEVRDIWPLSLVEIAGMPKWHPLVLWLGNIERTAYRQADAVVSLLPYASGHMQSRGLAPEKFNYIPNGFSLEEWDKEPDALPAEHSAAFERATEKGKLVVVYAGSFGTPNALDQVLDLASVPDNASPPYHFIMIGDGAEKQKLIQRISKERIGFVDVLPKVTKSQVITALKMADMCYLGAKKLAIYRLGVSPNKLADYFLAVKPVIISSGVGNNPVIEASAGIAVDTGDPQEFDKALRHVCRMSNEQREMLGANGRRYAMENLEWSILSRNYDAIIQRIAGGGQRREAA